MPTNGLPVHLPTDCCFSFLYQCVYRVRFILCVSLLGLKNYIIGIINYCPSYMYFGWDCNVTDVLCLSRSKPMICGGLLDSNLKIHKRGEVVCFGMLAPRKFLRKRKKVEVFKDAADEADQKNWRKLMNEIDESGSAVSVLRSIRIEKHSLPKGLVVGTLVRFKQLKKWNIVSEVITELSPNLLFFRVFFHVHSCFSSLH